MLLVAQVSQAGHQLALKTSYAMVAVKKLSFRLCLERTYSKALSSFFGQNESRVLCSFLQLCQSPGSLGVCLL